MYFKFLWAVLLVCCATSEKSEKKDGKPSLKILFSPFDGNERSKYVKVIPLIDDNGTEIVPSEAELTRFCTDINKEKTQCDTEVKRLKVELDRDGKEKAQCDSQVQRLKEKEKAAVQSYYKGYSEIPCPYGALGIDEILIAVFLTFISTFIIAFILMARVKGQRSKNKDASINSLEQLRDDLYSKCKFAKEYASVLGKILAPYTIHSIHTIPPHYTHYTHYRGRSRYLCWYPTSSRARASNYSEHQ